MVRMKLNKDEFDPDELDVEWEDGTFVRYDGEVPKTGTILTARVTKAWWTQTKDGDASMMKVLAIAEDNEEPLDEYDGLPIWENLPFKTSAAFRYGPFLEEFEITLKDVYNKMDVEEDDDRYGTPINSINGWVIGSDDALCRIVVHRDSYGAKVEVNGWLPYEGDEPEPEPERSARSSRRAAPAASNRRAPAASTSRTRSRRAEPEPEPDDADEYDGEEERPRGRSRAASRPRPASRSGGRTSGRTTGRSGRARSTSRRGRADTDEGYDDDPPF